MRSAPIHRIAATLRTVPIHPARVHRRETPGPPIAMPFIIFVENGGVKDVSLSWNTSEMLSVLRAFNLIVAYG
jgi:hypothetical protein